MTKSMFERGFGSKPRFSGSKALGTKPKSKSKPSKKPKPTPVKVTKSVKSRKKTGKTPNVFIFN